MTADVKFSTGLPNCREGRHNLIGSVDREHIVRVSKLAEELGYYSLWPNEFFTTFPQVAAKYAEPPNLYDTIVTMSYALAVTSRIRVTPSTIILPLHEPLLLSRQIATLDAFSDGRVTLGIGLGGDKEEFARMRADNPNRGKMMDEYTEALRVLWTQRRATFQGRYTNFTDVETHPKPVQDPLPILRAGHGEGVFEAVAKHLQGWIDSVTPPEGIAEEVARIRRLAAEHGRGGEHFEIARLFAISIATTEDEAKANLAATVPPATRPQPAAPAGGAPRAASAAHAGAAAASEPQLVGTPERILARLRDYAAAGCTEICAVFISPDIASAERQMRLFAAEVIARW